MEAALSLVGEGPPPANGQPEGRPCAAELTHSESPQQRNYIRFWNAINASIGEARLVFPYPLTLWNRHYHSSNRCANL